MGDIRNRSVRLDDDNYGWLQGLPGRSMNEAVERLRLGGNGHSEAAGPEISEILELVRSIPDAAALRELFIETMDAYKARKTSALMSNNLDPTEIPGIVRGVENLPPSTGAPRRRETFRERAIREAKEREAGARARSSAGDDPSISFDPEFVQD